MTKNFRIPAAAIKSIAMGYGSCIASDQITVDGCEVGFMYREPADHEHDSGWRFLSGLESRSYLDNPRNLGVYDVNTIVNYDEEVLRHLCAPVGWSLIRSPLGGFVRLPAKDDREANAAA